AGDWRKRPCPESDLVGCILVYSDLLDSTKNNNPPPVSLLPERWLSVDELAEYLGIKRDTVYKWINRRSVPGHKAGRLWKLRRDEVDAWVKSGAAGNRERNVK